MTEPTNDSSASGRRLPRRFLLGVPAAAGLVGLADMAVSPAAAAPGTTAWVLGGNTGVNTDGTNYLGTQNVAPVIFKTTATVARGPVERMRIQPNGTVGIGVAGPKAKLDLATDRDLGIRAASSATTAGATAILGRLSSTSPGADSAGVKGENSGTSGVGVGVLGTHAGGGSGVRGTSVHAEGVRGESTTGNGVAGFGGYAGTQGFGLSYGIVGSGVNPGSTGGAFSADQWAVTGYATSATGYGGHFQNATTTSTTNGVGVQGLGAGGTDALVHPSGSFYDAGGEFSGPNGVIGSAAHSSGYGLIGLQGPGSYALYCLGSGYVSDSFAVGGTKNFEIDHPLDPENKVLRHAAIESSEVKNVYDGVVTLNKKGKATVTLPEWMEALNRDFRYQLTPIGAACPDLHISKEVAGNTFSIAGGTAGLKVSWQVTGIRNDRYMRENPMEVESDKSAARRGSYLAPEAFGSSREKVLGHQVHNRAKRAAVPVPERPDLPDHLKGGRG